MVALTKYDMKEKTDLEIRNFTLEAGHSKLTVSNLRISLLSVRIKELYHAKTSLSVYEATSCQ